MAIEKIRVSPEEAKKYANVSRGSGEDFFEATIYTDADGNIDPERTYTYSYRNKENGLSKEEKEAIRDRAYNKGSSYCAGVSGTSCAIIEDFLEDASYCFSC